MNWEAISAIADAPGAAGVIATVIYLAVRIRHNTRSVQGATEQSLMSQEIQTYELIAAHAGVVGKGRSGVDDLGPEDSVVFEHLVLAQMSQIYGGWVQFKRGLIPARVWDAYGRGLVWALRDPGFLQMWESFMPTYPDDFQETVVRVTKEAGAV